MTHTTASSSDSSRGVGGTIALRAVPLSPPSAPPYLPIRGSKSEETYSTHQLTPLYPEDLPALVSTLNSPSVWPNLSSSPFPYSMMHAQDWLARQEEESKQQVRSGEAASEKGQDEVVRQIRVTETSEWVGQISATRWDDPNLVGAERDAAIAANDARALNDPELVWTVGYYLSPSASGRGLMTATLGTLILDYLVPVLGVRKMYSSAFTSNLASKRVLQKCGFEEVDKFESIVDEGRGGGVREQWLMEWRRVQG